jgi:gluconate 5-dehydrogenase
MPNPLFDLHDRIALITGSGGGLGFAIGRGMGQSGATVVLNGRNQAKLEAAVNTLRGEGIKAHGVPFDVTKKDEIESGVARIEAEIGPLEILYNNAGINLRAPLPDVPEALWHQVIDTNLTGALLVAQAAAKRMIPRKHGKIINMCSMMSELARATTASYAAAKGGLKMLTKSMALEFGPHNIQVNGIGPGYFLTEMTKPLLDVPGFNDWICKRTPANRWGRPEELIGAAVFLASPASSFVTGQVIYVDGGILATL